MSRKLCPVLVGRDGDVAELRTALGRTRVGQGGVVVLVGEAGIGKSRLASEVSRIAGEAGMSVLSGRATPGTAPAPYRPLLEAAMSGLRRGGAPNSPALRPYAPVLGRLLPDFAPAEPAIDVSAVVVAEAMLRLYDALGRTEGCVVVLEDLQWADPETLEVVEFLSDHAPTESVLCLATVRSEPGTPAAARLRALTGHGAIVMDLAALEEPEALRIAGACLGVDEIPEELRRTVVDFAEGNPFLIEELLATPTGEVPTSFLETVRQRLDVLGRDTADVLAAAAALGRQFDWQVLTLIAGREESELLEHLRRALDAQLVVADDLAFRFRHALTRDAVLALQLPPRRIEAASRALRAVEDLHPDLEDPWCELAADLAEQAGNRTRAAELLLEAGARAAARAALASAVVLLDAARSRTQDPVLLQRIDDRLLSVLTEAGAVDRALAVGTRLLEGRPLSEELRAAVRLRLARAAVLAGRAGEARSHLAAIEALVAQPGHDELRARHGALAARVAMDEDRRDEAIQLAEQSAATAEAAGCPEAACEALEVIGRAARTQALERAEEVFQRELAIAAEHGLPVWEVNALHELGTIDLLAAGRPDRLLLARERALDVGAVAAIAVIDLQLSACYELRFEADEALAAAERSASAARRLGLGSLTGAALMLTAGAHAMRGDRSAMETAAQQALALAPEDPDVAGGVWGAARATTSLLEEKRGRALRELDRAMGYWGASATSAPAHSRGLWALLRAVEDVDPGSAIDEVRRSGVEVNHANRGFLAYAEAVCLGRASRRAEAEAAVAVGDRDLELIEWWHQYARRLVAEAALDDDWGQPIEWLREAERYFIVAGHDRIATACRSLLRRAGVAVPARRRLGSVVPERLATIGVTAREAEVLGLLGEGLSNRQIAERLYLSPRTVEKHVESLQRKVGVETRARLIAFAAAPASF